MTSNLHKVIPMDEKGVVSDTTYQDTDLGEQEVVNGDLALKILKERVQGERYILEPAMRKRVLRKLDLHILPILTFTEMLAFLEIATVNYASIFGLLEDAHLGKGQFAWIGTIYYLGYLAMQPFAAHLTQRFSPSRCISVAIMVWAIVVFMSVLCNSFAKFMVVRFLLGASEAIVNPSFVLLTSAFYAREDQTFRTGIWFCANGIANIVGSISAYGLGHIHAGGLHPWKWMFLVCGAVTVFWAVIVFFFLPTNQGTARFFTEEEKVAAVEMVRNNNTGIHNSTFKRSQLKEAFLDPKSYFFFLFAFFGNLANSKATFGSLIISGFGFSPLETTLLGMPVGGVEVSIMIIGTYICSRFKNVRSYCIIVCNIIALLGSILVFRLPLDNKAGRLAGYYMFDAWPTGYAVSLVLAGSNTAGHTKKVVTNVFIMAGFCVSNAIGPQFFKHPPRYVLGIGSCMFAFAGMMVVSGCFQLYIVWLNKKRAPEREAALAVLETKMETGFEDLTDRENPLFLYVY